MSKACTNNPTEEKRKKYKFPKLKNKDAIKKATEEAHRRYEMLGRVSVGSPDIEETKLLAKNEEIWQGRIGDLAIIDPSQTYKWQTFLAVEWGALRKFDWFNPSIVYSVAGEVKKTLINSKRAAKSLISQAAAYTHVTRIHEAATYIRDNFEEVLSVEEMRELMIDTLEIGNIPKRNAIYGDTDGIRVYNGIRHDRYMQKWGDKGITPSELIYLKDKAADIAAAFAEVRIAAEASGFDIDKLRNLGYFPHLYRPEALEKIDSVIDTRRTYKPLNTTKFKEPPKPVFEFTKLGSRFEQARITNRYIPAHLDITSELLDIPRDELVRILANGDEWQEVLKKIPADTLDLLLDTGVLEKVPMSMSEILEVLNKEYSLGFDSIDDMFITDPTEALNITARNIERAAQNWSMSQVVLSEAAFKAGWAISKEELAKLPSSVQKNFDSIYNYFPSTVAQGEDKVPFLSKYFPPEEIEKMKSVYIHRVVARNLAAKLEIASSVTQLSNMARVANWWSRYLKGSVLIGSNIQFITRSLMDGMLAMSAAGGHFHDLMTSFSMAIARRTRNLEMMDNSKVFRNIGGKDYTQREFAQEIWARIDSRIPGIDPDSGIQWNAALNYIKRYSDNFRDPIYSKEIGDTFMTTIKNAAKDPLSSANKTFFKAVGALGDVASFVDEWMKINIALGVSRKADILDGIENIINLNARRPEMKSFEDVDRWITEHLPSTDMAGTWVKNIDRYIIPFFTWSSFNLGSTMRMMLRNPQRFLAYQRLNYLVNNARGAGGIPEVGFSPYEDDEPFVIKSRDPNTGHTMVLFPSNYDRVSSVLSWTNAAGKMVSRRLGFYPGTSREQRNQAIGKADWTETVRALFNSTYYAPVFSALAGVDRFTGEKLENTRQNVYLGFPMSPQTEAIIATAFPILDAFNRANPGDVLGRREIKDSRGRVIVKPKPAITGYSRTDRDAPKLAWDKGSVSDRIGLLLGQKIRFIDTHRNTQQSFTEIRVALGEIKKSVLREAQYLTVNKDSISAREYEERTQRMLHLADTWYQTYFDALRVRAYMDKNGIPPSEIYKHLDKENIQTNDLPIAGKEELFNLREEYIKLLNKTKPPTKE